MTPGWTKFLAKADLTLNLDQCEIRKALVVYLGEQVGRREARWVVCSSLKLPSSHQQVRGASFGTGSLVFL